MQRIFVIQALENKGKKVKVSGWVHVRRDHGKIIFIDLRDRSGLLQVVFAPSKIEDGAVVYENAKKLRSEWVVSIEGTVNERPANSQNTELPTGSIELFAEKLEILSESQTPPFDISDERVMNEVSEELTMKYKYLDLRRVKRTRNLTLRHRITKIVRDFLDNEGFLEIETPILTKSTPEGARDYLVPSRLQRGTFYALPQSPQQYKQLLMVGGIEKYFQIARCFRDEDTRGDRQPEFTQLDLEMSFVEREDIMALNEKLLIEIIQKLFPEKKIQETPFPRLSYKEAMEKYETDRPDLRKDKSDPNLLAFCWIVDFPFFERTDTHSTSSGQAGGWTFTHNPFSAPKSEFMDDLLAQKNITEILTTQYDIVLNGLEIGGGSIRNHKPEALEAVFKIMGFDEQRITENFGHMLEAFKFGAPPHGGIAWGFDRLVMILANEPNIREVIAFPKTGDGRDLMMNAPSGVSTEQLLELGISIKKNDTK